MIDIDSIDFSEWGFTVELNSGSEQDLVTSVIKSAFSVVGFSPFFGENRASPLDLSVTMPMDDDYYQVDLVPRINIDVKNVILDHVDCLLDFASTSDGDYPDKGGKDADELIKMKEELNSIISSIDKALNKMGAA
tara:strand:+ start:6424 stop:6828 length:405 start_codon:yes stop_codon:yes gene_type:complete